MFGAFSCSFCMLTLILLVVCFAPLAFWLVMSIELQAHGLLCIDSPRRSESVRGAAVRIRYVDPALRTVCLEPLAF